MAWVKCSCCGQDHLDTPEQNADYYDRGQDNGFGRCPDCYGSQGADADFTFGDIKELDETQGEDAVWELLGWAQKSFYQSRFEVLAGALSDENAEHFRGLPLWKKLTLIQDAVKEGMMI